MDTILDNFASDKLFPNSNLLDLEDLNESDFLSNVVSQTSASFIINSSRAGEMQNLFKLVNVFIIFNNSLFTSLVI